MVQNTESSHRAIFQSPGSFSQTVRQSDCIVNVDRLSWTDTFQFLQVTDCNTPIAQLVPFERDEDDLVIIEASDPGRLQ